MEKYFFGSNGKFIKTNKTEKNLPTVFGETSVKNFLNIKRKIDDSKIKYSDIENLFFPYWKMGYQTSKRNSVKTSK